MQYEKEPKSKSIYGAICLMVWGLIFAWVLFFFGKDQSQYVFMLMIVMSFLVGVGIVQLNELKDYFKAEENKKQ